MVSFILPGNSASGGYDVANSLRFNSGSSDYLNHETGNSTTSSSKTTLSAWVKRSSIGNNDVILSNIKYYSKKKSVCIKPRFEKKNTITNYDGAFFCNSIRLIWNINSIEGHKYKSNKNIINLINIINYEAYK